MASEALYHLGAKYKGYTPCYIKVKVLPNIISGRYANEYRLEPTLEINHWVLMNNVFRRKYILDPTSSQLTFGYDIDDLTPCGFLTKEPSTRCWALINRIQKIKEYQEWAGKYVL